MINYVGNWRDDLWYNRESDRDWSKNSKVQVQKRIVQIFIVPALAPELVEIHTADR